MNSSHCFLHIALAFAHVGPFVGMPKDLYLIATSGIYLMAAWLDTLRH